MKRFYESIPKEELYDLYIVQNKSIDELSKIYNVSVSSIARALNHNKIKKSRKQVCQLAKKTFIERYGVENPSQSEEIKEKKKQTFIEHYNTEHYFKTKEFKIQIKNTYLKRYGSMTYNNREKATVTCQEKYSCDNPSQIREIKIKKINTTLNHYGVENPSQSEEIKEKKKQTCFKHYGVEFPANIPGLMSTAVIKGYETRHKNGTFSGKCEIYIAGKKFKCSKFEKDVYNILITKYNNIKFQYKSEKYPFVSDFYIPSKDLYIELQGDPSHGKEPYDSNNIKHQNELKYWQNKLDNIDIDLQKKSRYYHFIEVWTIRDPLKRETAKKNNLNWIEFFTIEEFISWFKSNADDVSYSLQIDLNM